MSMIIRAMKKYGIEIVFYIDRITFYVDTRTHKDSLAPIVKSNPQNKLKTQDNLDKNKYTFQPFSLYHEHMDKKVELFQPSDQDLLLLAGNSVVHGDYAITYIEFAIDFLVKNKKMRRQLVAFFDKHLVCKHNRKNKTNFYFKSVGKNKGENQH